MSKTTASPGSTLAGLRGFFSPEIIAVRRVWSRSAWYRYILTTVAVYLLLRLAVQGIVLAEVIPLGPVGVEATLVSNDLALYLEAGERLKNQQDLYLQEALDLIDVYQYAPSFALLFAAFSWAPLGMVAVVHTFLSLAAYVLLYLWWGRIFRRLGLINAHQMLARTLPVWLVFSAFWGDLAYLNIYAITTLICTLLIEAVLEENLGRAVLWLAILLQTKPYLAFPLAVPLILGRHRFFLRLLILSILSYGTIVGVTVLVTGPAYGWEQQVKYFRFLADMRLNFPWRGPDRAFLGYNHSITQVILYLFGVTAGALRWASGLKMLLLAPLAVVSLRHLLQPARVPGCQVPRLSLDLTFALYAASLLWLDIVWEITLGIVIFGYLLATLEKRMARIAVWAVFLPYALLDFWQLASYAVLGPQVILPGFYIATDPSIYFPIVMLVAVLFYSMLTWRLVTAPLQLSRQRFVVQAG